MVKKTKEIENGNLSSLETENSTQQRKFIFFIYSPLSQEFLQKKNSLLYPKKIKRKKIKKINLKWMDIGINRNIINL